MAPVSVASWLRGCYETVMFPPEDSHILSGSDCSCATFAKVISCPRLRKPGPRVIKAADPWEVLPSLLPSNPSVVSNDASTTLHARAQSRRSQGKRMPGADLRSSPHLFQHTYMEQKAALQWQSVHGQGSPGMEAFALSSVSHSNFHPGIAAMTGDESSRSQAPGATGERPRLSGAAGAPADVGTIFGINPSELHSLTKSQ